MCAFYSLFFCFECVRGERLREFLLPRISLFLSFFYACRVRGFADFAGDSDWEDDVEDLLRDAAATAGFGGFEA